MYCSNLFGEMRREANFSNGVVEILRKSMREEREMMWRMEREKGISAIILSKMKLKKKKKLNYGNWIVEIEGLKKEKN